MLLKLKERGAPPQLWRLQMEALLRVVALARVAALSIRKYKLLMTRFLPNLR
jgi:hypothetical protein